MFSPLQNVQLKTLNVDLYKIQTIDLSTLYYFV
jgi:hypothetical protein